MKADCWHNKDKDQGPNGIRKSHYEGSSSRERKQVVCVVSECLYADFHHDGWWVDSDANRHIPSSKTWFEDFKEIRPGEKKIFMGKNTYSDVLGVGSCRLDVGSLDFILTDVYYVPSIGKNIVLVPCS